jgi:hypothetical protein
VGCSRPRLGPCTAEGASTSVTTSRIGDRTVGGADSCSGESRSQPDDGSDGSSTCDRVSEERPDPTGTGLADPSSSDRPPPPVDMGDERKDGMLEPY